jgi:hypothetical protein
MTSHPAPSAAFLLTMPLHAITEIYGEPGLRRRLHLELARLPPAVAEAVTDALGWAARLHAGQRRTREPYLNHLIRVTLRILCYYRITDADVLTAALLHDAVEDRAWAIVGRPSNNPGPAPRDEALTVIGHRYGTRVARLVAAVSHPTHPPGTDRIHAYLTHLDTALTTDPWARVLKLSDFTDNAVGIIHTVGPKVPHLARKYRPAVPVLRGLLARPDTPLDTPAKQHIDRQLDLAQQRIDAILAA